MGISNVLRLEKVINSNKIYSMLETPLLELKNGNSNALDEIYNQTNRLVYSIAFSYTKNKEDSEDIMMDTFLAIRKYINTYKEGSSPLAWISTIAKNNSKTFIAKKKKTVNVDTFYDSAVYKKQDNLEEKNQANLVLETCKQILKPKELEIVLMHLIDYRTFKEIAEIIGKNENTVRWKYNNAINKVKDKLNKEVD